MKIFLKPSKIRFRWGVVTSALLFGFALATVSYWYYGGKAPLSAEDVTRYIAEIEAQSQSPGGRHDLAKLRAFLESDDGNPFYTVNLYNFFEHAQYERGEAFDAVTGRQAFDRFSNVMIRLLAQHASHPIFGSDWVSSFSDWDRIVIVRYRSRRDIVDIFASEEFTNAAAHKWAGLEANERMLVQGLHIPELYIPLTLVVLIAVLCYFGFFLLQLRKES